MNIFENRVSFLAYVGALLELGGVYAALQTTLLQLTPAISNSLISKNCLSRSENLVPA